MADQIQRAEIAQHSAINWNSTSGAVIGSAATSGEGDGIYKWGGVVDDVTKWWEKKNQEAVQEGYVDEMNNEAHRGTFFTNKGYNEGRALYATTMQQSAITSKAAELNRLAATGEITEEERDAQVKALARDQQNYTLDKLTGKQREVAMDGLINTTAINAKNYVSEKERAAWLVADNTSIAVVNNQIEQLSSIVDTKDFAEALPLIFEQGRQATYAAWDKIPDGYKQARVKAEVTAVATLTNILGKLDPTNQDHILRGKLVAESAKNMQGMSQEGRDTIDKVMEKFNGQVQDFNSLTSSIEINALEEADSAGQVVTYEQITQARDANMQRVMQGHLSMAQGKANDEKLSSLMKKRYGDDLREEQRKAKEAIENPDPFRALGEYAVITDSSIEQAETKQAQEMDKRRQVQNGLQGDNAKIGMAVISDGQAHGNNKAIELGAKRMGNVIAPMFTMTKEELSAQDNANNNSTFQSWMNKYQHSITTNNYGMQQALLAAIPQEYRQALTTMATQGNPMLADTRTAIPEIVRTKSNLDVVNNSPAHKNFKFTTGFTNSTFFGSTGVEAKLGYAPSTKNQLINESRLQAWRDMHAQQFTGAALTDQGMVGDMIRQNYAIKTPIGGFPSVPAFHQNINNRGDVNAQIPAALYEMARVMVKENNGNFRIEDTNFIITGTEVQIQLRDKDGNAYNGSSKVFTTDQVRARIDQESAKRAKPYQKPIANPQAPSAAPMGKAAQDKWKAYFNKQHSAPKAPVRASGSRVAQQANNAPAPQRAPSVPTVQQARNNVVPQNVQQQRDEGRKGILQSEINNERKALAQAKLQLTTAKLSKNSKETAKWQRAIDDRNTNLNALNNELGRMK